MVSSDSAKVTVVPWYRYMNTTARSKAWLSGRNDNATSSESTRTTALPSMTLLATLPWVSITPFGSPVVPDV